MTHVLTKLGPVDGVWIKGARCLIKLAGGGRLVPTRRGVEVHVASPGRFARILKSWSM